MNDTLSETFKGIGIPKSLRGETPSNCIILHSLVSHNFTLIDAPFAKVCETLKLVHQ